MAYTQEGIVAQIMVAFGQGTGAMRIAQDAALQVQTMSYALITDVVTREWETVAVDVLEKARTAGKLAAQLAVGSGAIAIHVEDVDSSVSTVRATTISPLCPPPDPPPVP